MIRRAILSRRRFVLGAALSLIPAAGVRAEMMKVPRDHGEKTLEIVPFPSTEKPGTIIISNSDRTLHRVLGGGKAERYRISVGRDGFSWTGTTYVGSKKEWPGWRPPSAMRQRDPSLPDYVPPGPYNPLGARALYLYSNGRDTLYRIHGTNSADTVGGYETSGCFRLTNRDVLDLFQKVPTGTKVIVH
ncbi:L,D-transpeptidase [Thalassovita mangrovi]|uniref:L,D-transpeptidase family protein n=1 Tax=Thalassovita mangrovi TaxID=2692236 RepID=A0A6L8LL98_9RHOB|nr:L,D-transpeptidase [Thalassovita mangrovi]MYM55290.1 L,D-transpeptidase family protein [Thalassovita mangrovi]